MWPTTRREIHVLDVVVDTTTLELREIQYVVDDCEQPLTAPLHACDHQVLSFIHPALNAKLEEICVAGNR